MVSPQIFQDSTTQLKFNRDGYVVIDFISTYLAETIASYFYQFHVAPPMGFYAEAYNPDQGIKNEIFIETDKLLQDSLNSVFCNYKKLGSTFLCKAPGQEGKVNVHQDWTVVDESKFFSATIWIPLVDTTADNGALKVLPGSHLFFDAYRSNNIPVSYKGSEELLWNNMITVPMKAGQAFVLNHAVIHASAANLTHKERLVLAYGIIPDNARLLFYHMEKNEPNGLIEKYDMPDDFFQRYYNIGERPQFGKLIDKFDYPVRLCKNEEIKKLITHELELRNLIIDE
jgi:hypothetical protein